MAGRRRNKYNTTYILYIHTMKKKKKGWEKRGLKKKNKKKEKETQTKNEPTTHTNIDFLYTLYLKCT